MIKLKCCPQSLRYFSEKNVSTLCKTAARLFSVVVESKTNTVNQGCNVPDHISRPPYAVQAGFISSLFKARSNKTSVPVKTDEVVRKIHQACRVGRRVLNHVKLAVKAGVTTDDLDFIAHQLICQENAYPSPLNYQSFPKSICTSVNNVVVHGIPDKRKLLHGDLINVDISVYVDGVHGDLSETFLVGNVDEKGQNLVAVTKQCLDEAISTCQPGKDLNVIGKTISRIAHGCGFTVCPHFVGHGIGHEFHEMPQILHHDNNFPGNMLPGMVFTIEPVLCEGRSNIKHWKDGWTVVTEDKKRAAQFEHTLHITESGVEVLTKNDHNDKFLQPDDASTNYVNELLLSRLID